MALPVVLASFNGSAKDCQAYLTWTTATEINAAGFYVEQSTNGFTYYTVAYVPAHGMPSAYSSHVAQPVYQAYYRIRMVDLDGQSRYSSVTGVQQDCIINQEILSVYPNPTAAGGIIGVKLTAPEAKGRAELQLFDMSGRKIAATAVQVNGGINLYTLAAGGLEQGAYTVFVQGNGWTSNSSAVIVK
jgi:hypothetical protein